VHLLVKRNFDVIKMHGTTIRIEASLFTEYQDVYNVLEDRTQQYEDLVGYQH